MFTDEHRVSVWNEIRQHDLRAFSRFLHADDGTQAATRAGKVLGRGPLHLGNLVWLAVASALHTAKSFADLLPLTLKLLSDAEGFAATPLAKAKKQGQRRKKSRQRSKHDPRRADPTVVSEEAFVKARQRVPLEFWLTLLADPGRAISRTARPLRSLERVSTSRPGRHDDPLAQLATADPTLRHCQQRQRETQNPGAHALVAVSFGPHPLRLRVESRAQSEKTGAVKLLSLLQADDLVLLDRGFWSYGLVLANPTTEGFFRDSFVSHGRSETLAEVGAERSTGAVCFRPTASGGRPDCPAPSPCE